MNVNNTSADTPANPRTTQHSICGDPTALAASLWASAGYLRSCNNLMAYRKMYDYKYGAVECEVIAQGLRCLGPEDKALVKYRKSLCDLDNHQIEAFSSIKIDYQARIRNEFTPTSTDKYLADLTLIAFAVAAIEDPTLLDGVGLGFA